MSEKVIALKTKTGRPEDALAWLQAEFARQPLRGVFIAVQPEDPAIDGAYRLVGTMTAGHVGRLAAVMLKWAAEDE